MLLGALALGLGGCGLNAAGDAATPEDVAAAAASEVITTRDLAPEDMVVLATGSIFNSAPPIDAPSATAAVTAFLNWCATYFDSAQEAPRFTRAAFKERAEGFGLWAMVPTDVVSGAREEGACVAFIQSETVAMLPDGVEGLIAATQARFGLTSEVQADRTENGWPIRMVDGAASAIGQPMVMRFMEKRPDSLSGDDGDVKVTLGLLETES